MGFREICDLKLTQNKSKKYLMTLDKIGKDNKLCENRKKNKNRNSK